jgi:small subunit ribosomal protein S17
MSSMPRVDVAEESSNSADDNVAQQQHEEKEEEAKVSGGQEFPDGHTYETSALGQGARQAWMTWHGREVEGEHFDSEKWKLHFERQQKNKPFEATVLWKKQAKTAMCLVKTLVEHPKYGKRYHHMTKLLVHDEYDEVHEGDIVLLRQSRPYSKRKRHIVDSIKKPEIGRGHFDKMPEHVSTNALRRALADRHAAKRRGTVFMSDVQRLYLSRELRRLDLEIENAKETTRQAAEARQQRVEEIRAARARDRAASLERRRRTKPARWQRPGTGPSWRWDSFIVRRKGKQ